MSKEHRDHIRATVGRLAELVDEGNKLKPAERSIMLSCFELLAGGLADLNRIADAAEILASPVEARGEADDLAGLRDRLAQDAEA
jgi:hypothetical protein